MFLLCPLCFRFITKTYTGRGLPDTAGGGGGGGGWSESAHVTHTAYLTDDLVRDKHTRSSTSSSIVSPTVGDDISSTGTSDAGDGDHAAEAATFETKPTTGMYVPPTVSNPNRHAGFWGVWEPVLGRAGGGGGGGSSITASSRDSTGAERWRTTLNKRGGAFRFVPRKGRNKIMDGRTLGGGI